MWCEWVNRHAHVLWKNEQDLLSDVSEWLRLAHVFLNHALHQGCVTHVMCVIWVSEWLSEHHTLKTQEVWNAKIYPWGHSTFGIALSWITPPSRNFLPIHGLGLDQLDHQQQCDQNPFGVGAWSWSKLPPPGGGLFFGNLNDVRGLQLWKLNPLNKRSL